MPDVLIDFINYGIHEDLKKAYDLWFKSSRQRDREEFKNSVRLGEMLARETRIWVLSKLVSERQLSADLVLPPDKTDFGKELNFLDSLQHHPFLKELTGSRPDATERFVPLEEVFELVKRFLNTASYTLDQFKNDFDALAPSTGETWLQTMRFFQRFRNLEGHDAAQLTTDGTPAFVVDKLANLTPAIVRAMRVRIDWMIRRVAVHLGGYELQSKADIEKDRDYSVQVLLKAKPPSGFTTRMYVRFDEERNATELFARLENSEQVQSSKLDLAEVTDSKIFRSAENGLFLPLIGTTFGLPDRQESPGAAEVLARARAVVGQERFRSLETFLARVVSQRLGFEVKDLKPLTPMGTRDTGRDELVGELALLASQAARAIGSALAKSGPPLTGEVEVLDEADVKPLREQIGQVLLFLNNSLGSMPTADRVDLGLDAIANGLLVLDRHDVESKKLSLASIAWLNDLVWHALRWDAPFYPDSRALDLQLSLGVQRDPDRGFVVWGSSTAFSSAVLYLEPPKLNDYLVNWSRRMEGRVFRAVSSSRGWRDPYRLVAKAMALCLEKRQGLDADLGVGYKKNVFVVDATFDQRMCNALEKAGAKVAVVYPVDIIDENNIKYPAWGMRRSKPVEASAEYSVLWDDCDRTINYQDVPRVIVIKPFGAPLESVEQLARAVDRAKATLQNFPIDDHGKVCRYRVEPKYLFDDVSILRDIIRIQDSMPPGFRQAIHDQNDPFELFFLGYGIEEYGRRARMIADVRPPHDIGRDVSAQPRYLSQPPPSGLTYQYLKRAGLFIDDSMPLQAAMKDLALSLDQCGRWEEAKP
jgi:hypothetical protein